MIVGDPSLRSTLSKEGEKDEGREGSEKSLLCVDEVGVADEEGEGVEEEEDP